MANDDAKLFVAGLPDSVSEEILKQLFESAGGKVVDVRLPKEQDTGRPRGFGFVTFSSPAEAQAAREALDGTLQNGKSISVRPCLAEPPKRGERGPGGPGGPGGGPRSGGPSAQAPDRTLYVGNLPYDCTQQEVETLVMGVLAGEGQVVRVHLPTDPEGRKRGFGFVTLSSSEAAKAAAEALKTADMKGRRLVVNLAHPKGEGPRRDGPPGGGGGGPGGGGGGFPRFAPSAPPAPQRRTFDSDKRRNKFEDGGGPRTGGGRPVERERGGGGRRGGRGWDTGDDD